MMVQRMRPVAPMKVEDVVGLSPIADVGTGRPDPGHVLQIHPTEVGDVVPWDPMDPGCAHAQDLETMVPRGAYNMDVETLGSRDPHILDMKMIGARGPAAPGIPGMEPGGAAAPGIPGMEPGGPAAPGIPGMEPGELVEQQRLDVNLNPEERQDPHTGVVLRAISAVWATWNSSVNFLWAGPYQHPSPRGRRLMGPMMGEAL